MSKTATAAENRYDELGIDRAVVADTSAAPWDAIWRPAKSVADYNGADVERECVRLAAVFLTRSGYTDVEASPIEGTDLRATDPRGDVPTDVLIVVRGSRDLDGDGLAAPSLSLTEQEGRDLRWCLSSLAQWCDCDSGSYRADVMAVTITGERTAKLRHLLGAAWHELA